MSQRLERKFLIDDHQKSILLGAFKPYLEAADFTDERATYPVLSLYFDSPSLLFYAEKLDGELLRTKIRLRGYGTDWNRMAPCFLEVKRKIDARIIKYRKRFERFSSDLMDPHSWSLEEDRAGAELAIALHRYQLRPVVQVLYQRQALQSPHAQGLRIAFDSQLFAFHPFQAIDREALRDPRHRCLGDRQFIFEVKSDGELPAWVRRGLHAAQVTQRAISKYVIGVEQLQLERAEIGVYA